MMSSPSHGPSAPPSATTDTDPSRDRRRERSARTRRRIADAAYELFADRGFGVPIGDIATAAGVSVQTVFVTYRNKVGLAQAALERAVLGDAAPVPPHRQPWFEALRAAPDPAAAIRIWVKNTLPIYARVAPLAGMFLAEPSVGPIWRHSEELRIEGFREVMTIVAAKGILKADLTVERAADVMFVLLGPLTYEEFVTGRGWSPEAWGGWVAAILADSLFEETPQVRRRDGA